MNIVLFGRRSTGVCFDFEEADEREFVGPSAITKDRQVRPARDGSEPDLFASL
jgi:hypothetical protein